MERFTKAEEKIIKEIKEHMSPRLHHRHLHQHQHHHHEHHHQNEQKDNEQNDNTSDKQKDNSRSSSSSRSSSPSPPSRDKNQEKYLHDPIRNTKHPDHLGEFRDPIYQHQGSSICSSPDITNTGA